MFSQKGNHIPQRYENIISNEISMMTLSPEENFFVFDKNNISDTIFKGKSDVALSACIHFDTQIISYLERIFDDGPKDDYIYNTYSFLRKILINQLDFTNDLYMIENGYKIENLKTLEKTKECLLAYNFYKNNNADAFERNFGFKPRYSEADYTFVETTIKQMQKFEEYHLVFFKLFETILCLLLKLACIDFSSQKSYKNKFLQLNDFINQELGMYTERELAI